MEFNYANPVRKNVDGKNVYISVISSLKDNKEIYIKISTPNKAVLGPVTDKAIALTLVNAKAVSYMVEFDNTAIESITKNSKEWFNQEKNVDEITECFKPSIVCYDSNDKGDMLINLTHIKYELLDKDFNPITLDVIKDLQNSRVTVVLKPSGIKITKNHINIEWDLIQLKLVDLVCKLEEEQLNGCHIVPEEKKESEELYYSD